MSNLYPLFIPLAPLIAALFTAPPKRFVSSKNYKIGWWIIFAGFVASLLMLWQAIQSPEPTRLVLFSTPWKYLPVMELVMDRLSAVMMVLISGFATLLYHYSIRYLQQDSGQARYLTLLATKLSAGLFMVSSTDLLSLFIFWQVSGWFLALLSHNYAHLPTAQGSFRTFIMLRLGDLAFLAGIVLAYHLYGTVQFGPLFERAAADQVILTLFGTGLGITGATAVTLLIFIGAMSKSVQFPLHMWLPDALYAPTPVTAMLHAGGVNGGGFLMARLAPLYVLSPTALHIALLIGLITAILGTSMTLVQNDIKKTLGYSTIAQMGYMIMECGLGAFPLAVFHLLAHGLFKAEIFLNSGTGIHDARLHPVQPPQPSSSSVLSTIGWVEAFVLSLLVPLLIAVGAHYVLGISFLDSQGLLILMLFSWVTASHAMLTVFRLKEAWLTKGVMLVGIALVATAYFFAAERFTHFLIPESNVVEAYLHAAELPNGLFMALMALLVLSIAVGWFFTVQHRHNNKRMPWPEWLKEQMYLFLMNRFYLDGIALRLFGTLKRIGKMIDRSPVVLIVIAVISLAVAFGQTTGLSTMPVKTIALLLLSALLVPLFPFHGLYVTALTRAPRALSTALCGLLPVLGICAMTWLLPEIPSELLGAIRVLAAVGALWGSIKALLQVNVSRLLSYGGLAMYSILWLHFAQVGKITPQALLYAWTVTLVWGGLLLAWDRIRVRYGDLDLNRIGGLFQPMPYFGVCMGILIMAAVGLPPFGLFFGYLGILLSPSTGISFCQVTIIATWFAACWYLFKLMQQLLFGPSRKDIHYEDLRPAEIAAFVLVIVLLIIPSVIPEDWLSVATTEITWNSRETP
jgi:NADH-quinone oxidoreductase subunit L